MIGTIVFFIALILIPSAIIVGCSDTDTKAVSWILSLFIAIMGFGLGVVVQRDSGKTQMVERGFGGYDKQTGEFIIYDADSLCKTTKGNHND